MATLSPGKLAVLIERFIEHGFRKPHRTLPDCFTSVRTPGAARVLTGEQIDSIWLQRVELRTPKEAENALKQMGLALRSHSLSVLFVDKRCGLICAETMGLVDRGGGAEIVRRILRLASGHHADGVILATNDPGGRIADSWYREMIMSLRQKGNAINIPLLDHFVLTGTVWKSMFNPEIAERR